MEVHVPTTPSDIRLKENIESLQSGLSLIKQLRPVQYNLKQNNERLNIGFIAQEVETVIPSLALERSKTSEDGSPLKGIKYQELIPVLIKAVQEQQQELEETQELLNKALEELDDLESQKK